MNDPDILIFANQISKKYINLNKKIKDKKFFLCIKKIKDGKITKHKKY